MAGVRRLLRGYALLAAFGVLGALVGSPRPEPLRILAGVLTAATVVSWLCRPRRWWASWLRVVLECAAIGAACAAVDTPQTASGLMFGVCVLYCLMLGRRAALLRAGAVLAAYVGGSAVTVFGSGGGGAAFGVAISPTTGLIATCVGMQWMVQALAGQAAAQATAQASLAELSAVVDTTPAALLVLDEAGRLVRYNPAAELLYGLPPYQPSQPLSGLTPRTMPGGNAAQWAQVGLLFARARAGEQLRDEPTRWTRADGTELALSVSTASVALPDPAGADRTGVLAVVSDVTAREALEAQLRRAALTDELTGLANRALFCDRLDHALAGRGGDGTSLAVLLIDLDGFKVVNDTGGHRAGDLLLHDTAARMSAALGRGDTLARLGGDEFAVLLEATTADATRTAATAVLEALRATVALPDGSSARVCGSIGVNLLPGDLEVDVEAALADADLAMYAAKRAGGDRVAVFEPGMRTALNDRLARESELRTALTPAQLSEQIVVHYQPYIDLGAASDGGAAGRFVGVEALVRWAHPTRGLLAPAEFIPLAEETGLIVPLGVHVLTTAVAQVRAWQRTQQLSQPDVAPLTVSVNLSVRQLTDPQLAPLVAQVLHESGLPPHTLTLELTESVLATDDAATLTTLTALKELGVRLAVDDFGTGYSALSYLQRFPLDVLKVDRSFVRDLPNAEATPLAASIIGLAQSLGMTTVAEGIETAAQADVLQNLGCDTAQGFHFARPMPADQLTRLLGQDSAGDQPHVAGRIPAARRSDAPVPAAVRRR